MPSVSCEKKIFICFLLKFFKHLSRKVINFQIDISIEQKKYFVSHRISNLLRWQHCASTLNVARAEAAFQLRISVYLWLFNIDFL